MNQNSAIPRRNQLELNKQSEAAIYNAIREIELLGADERLTDAVNHLTKAKDLIGDYIDEKLLEGKGFE